MDWGRRFQHRVAVRKTPRVVVVELTDPSSSMVVGEVVLAPWCQANRKNKRRPRVGGRVRHVEPYGTDMRHASFTLSSIVSNTGRQNIYHPLDKTTIRMTSPMTTSGIEVQRILWRAE